MSIQLNKEEEEQLRTVSDTLWTKCPSDVGLITCIPPVEIIPTSSWRPRVKQYPLKPEPSRGIESVVKDLLQAGIIRECPDSPCNNPIFPLQKANKIDWRLISNLRCVNLAVQTRAPLVPDPHPLHNSLSPN